MALVVAALATEAYGGRRRNQKFWKSRRRDRDRNSADDDFFRWGKGAAAGRQANMAFKLPDGRTTVSAHIDLCIYAFLSSTRHLVVQYQGGAGNSGGDPEKEDAGVPSGPNCMKKLMLVNEIVYEEKVKVSATKPVPNKRASVTLIPAISVSPQLQEELLRHFRDHLRARGGE